MANQVTGRMLAIGQTVQIPSKTGGDPFKKREFLLDATTYDPYTGERSQYENVLPLEVSGDKCAELDHFCIGDVVTVSFALQGRQWQTQDGDLKRMTSIRCYKLEGRQPMHQPASVPAQQPAPSQTPTMAQAFPPDVNANGNIVEDPLPF